MLLRVDFSGAGPKGRDYDTGHRSLIHRQSKGSGSWVE